VGTVQFESREQAYLRFRALWSKDPDLVAAVGLKQLPESFRLRLADASQYTALRAQYAAMVVLAEPPDRPDGATPGSPELRLALVDALARLTVEDRAVLVLRHAEDLSVDTVAAILGVSTSVVKMRNARARTRLRALLGEDFLER
jgi:RNA polymerase sigma factor (sigma-70 family)